MTEGPFTSACVCFRWRQQQKSATRATRGIRTAALAMATVFPTSLSLLVPPAHGGGGVEGGLSSTTSGIPSQTHMMVSPQNFGGTTNLFVPLSFNPSPKRLIKILGVHNIVFFSVFLRRTLKPRENGLATYVIVTNIHPTDK